MEKIPLPEEPKPHQIRHVLQTTDEPVLSAEGIGEAMGVTATTVRNHIDEALNDRAIHQKTVGTTTVYYHDDITVESHKHTHFRPFETFTHTDEKVLTSRALWQEAKRRYHTSGSDEDLLWNRLHLYYTARDYLEKCGGMKYSLWEVRRQGVPEEKDYSEHVQAHHEDRYLFTSDWFGDVVGFSGFLEYDAQLTSRINELAKEELDIDESDDVDVSDGSASETSENLDKAVEQLKDRERVSIRELPEEQLDELFPDIATVLHVGEVIDQFTVELHGIGGGEA